MITIRKLLNMNTYTVFCLFKSLQKLSMIRLLEKKSLNKDHFTFDYGTTRLRNNQSPIQFFLQTTT